MELKKVCANCWQITRFEKSENTRRSETVRAIFGQLSEVFWGFLAIGNFIFLLWFMFFIAY